MILLYLTDPANADNMSPLGSPIVLQRKGSVYGANVPMITELVNDSNVQFLGKTSFFIWNFKNWNVKLILNLFFNFN